MFLTISEDDNKNEMFLIHEIDRQLRISFEKRIKHLGLTRAQYRVLKIVKRNPEIKQHEIALLLEVKPMTLVPILNRMENNGWIKRQNNPKDKRANTIHLTKKVGSILEEIKRIALLSRRDAVIDFDAKEHEQLLRFLHRIKLNIAKMS